MKLTKKKRKTFWLPLVLSWLISIPGLAGKAAEAVEDPSSAVPPPVAPEYAKYQGSYEHADTKSFDLNCVASPQTRISLLEKEILGAAPKHRSIISRLGVLERQLFGAEQPTGNILKRLNQLEVAYKAAHAKPHTYVESKPLEGRVESTERSLVIPPNIPLFSDNAPNMYLRKSAEHTAALPACPSNLRAGTRFDENELSPRVIEEGWYWIPSWLAGNFHREICNKATQRIACDDGPELYQLTSSDRFDSSMGFQMDKAGGIWNDYAVPYVEQHNVFDCCAVKNFLVSVVEFKIVIKVEVLELSNSECILRSWSRIIRLKKASQIIDSVYQQEELRTFRRKSPGKYEQVSSVKWFDEWGKPTLFQGSAEDVITSDNFRVKPFSPVNNYHGKDMVVSFRSFLVSHDLAHLVPRGLK